MHNFVCGLASHRGRRVRLCTPLQTPRFSQLSQALSPFPRVGFHSSDDRLSERTRSQGLHVPRSSRRAKNFSSQPVKRVVPAIVPIQTLAPPPSSFLISALIPIFHVKSACGTASRRHGRGEKVRIGPFFFVPQEPKYRVRGPRTCQSRVYVLSRRREPVRIL